jgi:hypothetical protein
MYNVPQRSLREMNPHEYLAVPKHYTQKRQCVQCGSLFHEYSNLGRLQCNLHPGELRYRVNEDCYAYSCCDRLTGEIGCRASDHMDEFPSDHLPARWDELKKWSNAEVPLGMYWFGLQVPHDENVSLLCSNPTRQIVTLTLTLPDTQRGAQRDTVTLDSQVLEKRIVEQASHSKLLLSMLDQKTDRQRLKDTAMENIEKQRTRRQAGLRNEDMSLHDDVGGTRVSQFIPFVVFRRLAL